MTAATTGEVVPTFDVDSHLSWWTRRRLTRQLGIRDDVSARLAELHNIAGILNQAADMISSGWLQHSWFAYRDDNGRTKTVTAYNVNEMAGRPVIGACLVGAIVQAGGGLSKVRTQPVQRALDITWHTLFETTPQRLGSAYPKLDQFRALVERSDPTGMFANELTSQWLGR